MNLMLGLSSKGIEPILLSTPPAKHYRWLYSRLRSRGVRLILSKRAFGGLSFWIWLFIAAINAVKRFGIDLVHCHGTKEAFFVGLAAKLLRRSVIYTVEGDPLLEIRFSPEKYSILDRVSLAFFWLTGLNLADVVVGCSEWMSEHLKNYGVKALHIHNAIDYERFSKLPPKNGDQIVIVSVARFEKVKGLDTLLRASAEVVKREPSTSYILIGGGSLKNYLEELSDRLGISRNIRILDYSSEVDEILASSTIAVLPSIYEPFGLAAAEALAAGKPVIASRVGGLKEIVFDGVNGFLFTPGDHRELADKILKLLRDRSIRSRMAKSARETAERFEPRRIADQYIRIYRGLLK